MDYLMPFQSGIRNIVASLGTSLTARQIRQLKRYTRAIVLLYDPDEAGELATLRGLDLLLEEDMSVKVAVLPEGLDPDTFTVRHGAAKLQQLIQEAHNLFEYKLEVLCGKFNKKEVGQKIKIIEEMLPTIKRVKNEVLRLEYVRKLSEALGVSEQALITELKKVKSEHARYETSEHAEIMISEQSLPAAEKLAIGLMLSDAKLCALFHSSVALNDFRHHHLRKMADMIFAHTRAGGELSPHALMHMCDDEALTAIITQAILEAEVVEDKARVAQDCIARIRKDSGKSKLQQIQELIKEAEAARDEQRVNELMREYSALVRTHFK